MAVNYSCRFCQTNLKINGVLSNSKLLFDKRVVDNVSSQLSKLGLIIQNTPHRSYRVCRKCCNTITRLVRDTEVLQQWKNNETATVVETCLEKDASTFADKRDGEPKPPKTRRKSKSTDLPVSKRSSMTKKAMRNVTAALECEQRIICHSPTSDKDRTSNMINPTPSNASDCSENNILQNIGNPDVIKGKAGLLQVTNIPAANDTHQMEHREATLKMVSDNIFELVYFVGEENDQTDLSDVFSDPGDLNFGEEWKLENKILFGEKLQVRSDEEIFDDVDEDVDPPRHTELCTDCGTFFKTDKPHTCEHIIKPLSCNTCGIRFINKLSLKHHTKIHYVSYEFSCKCCHMKFKTKAAKTAHEQNHLTEEKPFKCLDCSETFATYKERIIHLKRHKRPEELKCHVCGLKFYRIESLRRHKIVHTGEKLYKCVVCKRGFNQPGNLKSHMRLHTGEKPFKCQHCDQGFHHNVSLKTHIQRYHTPGSECQQKKTTKRKHDSGDYVDFHDECPNSCFVEAEQDTDDDAQLEEMYRCKTNKKNTGRPKGRQKKKKVDSLLQAEETQEQGSDLNKLN